jgi:hypothetical protein
MRSVNRSTVIVRPRKPYVEWARGVDDEAATVTAAELCRDPTVYLIPEVTDEPHAEELIRDCFAMIFENELNGWIIDETAWPANRTYEMFRQWFDIEIDSMVIDLCQDRFEVEDL